ncbi:unnamed protein product [Gongylonema pulchrum]|uniref:Uncharacterized protein n=1 Tax=Gongylonema pulchrum TaxID=637853 RepID=A0A183EXV4_9BILA|nr:unnamed protein product [Gongylonema pulchrum]
MTALRMESFEMHEFLAVIKKHVYLGLILNVKKACVTCRWLFPGTLLTRNRARTAVVGPNTVHRSGEGSSYDYGPIDKTGLCISY